MGTAPYWNTDKHVGIFNDTTKPDVNDHLTIVFQTLGSFISGPKD